MYVRVRCEPINMTLSADIVGMLIGSLKGVVNKMGAERRDDWLTAPEVAKILAMARQTITKKIRKGEVPAKMFGGRWAIARDDIDKIIVRGVGNPQWTSKK